jgi:Holliday junction resolvase RusA-like endonuclease
MHHMERHRVWKGFRDEVGWTARGLVNQNGSHPPFARAHVKCIIHARSPRHFFDHDNAHSVVKPLVDALKGVLIVDDDTRHIELEVVQSLGERRGVTLEVSELPA